MAVRLVSTLLLCLFVRMSSSDSIPVDPILVGETKTDPNTGIQYYNSGLLLDLLDSIQHCKDRGMFLFEPRLLISYEFLEAILGTPLWRMGLTDYFHGDDILRWISDNATLNDTGFTFFNTSIENSTQPQDNMTDTANLDFWPGVPFWAAKDDTLKIQFICEGCVDDDANCPAGQVCYVPTGQCLMPNETECTPSCNLTETCLPVCGPDDFICVGCVNDDDCAGTEKCGPNGVCMDACNMNLYSPILNEPPCKGAASDPTPGPNGKMCTTVGVTDHTYNCVCVEPANCPEGNICVQGDCVNSCAEGDNFHNPCNGLHGDYGTCVIVNNTDMCSCDFPGLPLDPPEIFGEVGTGIQDFSTTTNATNLVDACRDLCTATAYCNAYKYNDCADSCRLYDCFDFGAWGPPTGVEHVTSCGSTFSHLGCDGLDPFQTTFNTARQNP